jgi:hypothetical protein
LGNLIATVSLSSLITFSGYFSQDIVKLAPTSFFIIFIYSIFCLSAIIWIWKDLTHFTRKETLYRANLKNSDLNTESKKNVKHIFCEPDYYENCFRFMILFERPLYDVDLNSTFIGAEMRVISCNLNAEYAVIIIEEINKNMNFDANITFKFQ